MNKYELALVVSAKIEDEVRDAVVKEVQSVERVGVFHNQEEHRAEHKQNSREIGRAHV